MVSVRAEMVRLFEQMVTLLDAALAGDWAGAAIHPG